MNWPQFLIVLQLFLVNCLIESASDQGLPRLLPLSEDDALSTKERFEQIMQSGNPSGVDWKPKLKSDTIDVKAEIAKLNSSYIYQSGWPDASLKLGAVTAVSFDKDGNVVIFHRVDRIWSQNTFNINTNLYQEQYRGPIDQNTVLALDRKSGELVYGWGSNMFYMPHGLTIDSKDNVWVTDVALHQVMKFGPRGGNGKPLLTLGTAFTPGNTDTRFCKPTSVAVLPNGDFFVADGYCNGRIIKYSANGEKILVWGKNAFAGEVAYKTAPRNFFAIPHALTLVPEQELVCAADRENGRIQCFSSLNGTFHSQYHSQIVGDRLFSMDYTPAEGGQFVVVNGPTGGLGLSDTYNEVRGYIINMKNKQVIGKFGPNDLQFSNPHDVAVTSDGTEIYVAELDPTRVHKFLHKRIAPSLSMSAAKPTATSVVRSTLVEEQQSQVSASKSTPSSTALLVAALMLFFALLTFGMALLIARRRKRGNSDLPMGTPCDLVYKRLVSSNHNDC